MILNDVSDIKIGSTDVQAVYLGDTLVWSRSAPPSGTVTLTSSDFSQGGISSDGSLYSSNYRIRANDYIDITGHTALTASAIPVNPNWTMYWAIQGYTANYTSSRAYETYWQTQMGTTIDLTRFPADTVYIKFMIRWSDEDRLTTNQLDKFEYTLS